ncbi:hypothetical protein B0T18DRAFT_392595 [Schizothecium vesticola]|uniref:Uncharacterized protein n=1 Tax=Schizothecium vesticola TaxID=314040 RepID=A0AA40ER42_9PEZI|nr:hypothetical protein B0T18DRAFT_392595 [Schizothecium vesticola]
MESSPLIKAYDHARAAASATHTADTTVAITEHALAAGEFANAAQNTQSTEGLRTLHLLEQHHKRLSELLKQPLDTPSQQSTADSDLGDEEEKDGQGQDGDVKGTKSPTPESAAAAVAAAAASTTSNKSLPTLPQQRRYQGRELSSSIASNLASARGIKSSKYRGQPVAPSVSNDQAPGSLEARPRRGKADGTDHSRKPSWIPPTQDDIKEDEPTGEASGSSNPRATAAPADDGFSRFYSTFGSLITRLSAPLAFSGLPLVAENPAAESATLPPLEPSPTKRNRVKTSTAAEPELSRIYSRATLRALARDGHGGDSFYVVPPSGHTATYASILNHENKERRRTAASREDADFLDDQDDDDFVDAREVQHHSAAPPTTLLSGGFRKRLGKARSEREMQVTIEELHTENASLKEMLDKLSKRLHAFELGSQSTHLALAQSIRLHRPGSPMSSSSGGVGPPAPGPGDEALRKRNRELEEQMEGVGARMAGMQQEIERLNGTLDKYRDRWEKLKAGAKARREAQGPSGEGETLRDRGG